MDTLEQRFAQAGYRINPSEKSHYARGLVRLLGNAAEALALPSIVRLLSNAQVRKGRAYTYNEMQQLAQPQTQVDAFRDALEQLLESGAFAAGYRVACHFCSLVTWHQLAGWHGPLSCAGCQTLLQLPLTANLAFQPNPLLCEGLKSGLLSVLLLQRYLQKQIDDEQIAFWHCYILQGQDSATDLDLIMQMSSGQVLLAECKDNYSVSSQSLLALERQLNTLQQVGKAIGASIYFATLREEPPPEKLQHYLLQHHIHMLAAENLRSS